MVSENIRVIRQRIQAVCERTGRKSSEITIVAVTKSFGVEKVKEAVAEGLYDIGENYVQELQTKRAEVGSLPIRWHFIGHLQRRKVKEIVPWIYCIHSVDSFKLGLEISKHVEKTGRSVDVLVEVNIAGEETKFGVSPESTPMLVSQLTKLDGIRVIGLMTIGPYFQNPEDSRPIFRKLRMIKEQLKEQGYDLPHLSMGMSNDYEIAIEEGATMVRIGTAIFGHRS